MPMLAVAACGYTLLHFSPSFHESPGFVFVPSCSSAGWHVAVVMPLRSFSLPSARSPTTVRISFYSNFIFIFFMLYLFSPSAQGPMLHMWDLFRATH